MIKTPMVTRTVKTTTVTVKLVDTNADTVQTKEFTLPRVYKDEKAALKAVKALTKAENITVLSVTGLSVHEELRGMTEDEFVEHSRVLPPRNAKTETIDEEPSEPVVKHAS